MDFEGLEISEQEHEKWIEGWPERYKDNQPGLPAWKVFVASKKQQILEERLGIRAEKMVACLQKWYGLLMSELSDSVKPDLTKPLPTKEQVNDFKVRVINFFKNELYHSDGKTVKPYWLEQGIDQLPPWEGLSESAWLNFFREFHRI